MPIKVLIAYMCNKYKKEMQRDRFMMDCLWVRAVGAHFSNDKNEPTYPRWHDVINPPKQETKPKLTKEMVKNQFKRLIKRRK